MLLERIMELGPRVFCIADHWPIEFHHTTKKKMAWHNRDNSTSRVVDRFGAMLKTCPRLTLSLGGTRTLKKCVLELQLAPRGSAGAHQTHNNTDYTDGVNDDPGTTRTNLHHRAPWLWMRPLAPPAATGRAHLAIYSSPARPG